MARRRSFGAGPVTKPGKYGTLYRYAIRYTDAVDPGFGVDTWHTWAYDPEHAADKFYEGDPDGGWKLLDVKRVTAR